MSTQPRSHEEIAELLAAYALDAVEAEEAIEIEEHVQSCPRCRAELAEHRETAALLVDAHAEPPPELWDRLEASLEEVPPPLDLARYRTERVESAAPAGVRQRRPAAARIAAVAAAVILILGMGTVAWRQQAELDDVRAELDEHSLAVSALAALEDPEARRATLTAEDGSTHLMAVLLPDGSGYLLADQLPELDEDRTYQLWAVLADERVVSAGVMGASPGIVNFEADADTTAFAITEEVAGGVEQSEQPALASGAVES